MAESTNTRHENWIRVVWGLLYVKEGLHGWVDTKCKDQYQTFRINVIARCYNQTCNHCQINSRCLNGSTRITGKSKFRRGHFCDEMYREIIQNTHVRLIPFWGNTDSTMWQDPNTGYWEVAKCFLNRMGYMCKTNSNDVETSELLSICINSSFINQYISNIEQFHEVKNISNRTLRAAHYMLDRQTADMCLDKMIALLEDPRELVNDTFAKKAADKIKMMKPKDETTTAVITEALVQKWLNDFNVKTPFNELEDAIYVWLRKNLKGFKVDEDIPEVKHTRLDDSGNDEREQKGKDDWGICLKNVDIEGIWELLKDEKVPTYDTFLKAVDKLSTQTDNLRDFCRFVSKNLKRNIPNAKIVYPAINPKNKCIAFVVLSTSPSDQKYIGGYPVKMKYAYGHCNEDFSIRNKETKEDLCFESREDETNINSAVRSAHAAFSEWPNYSRTSFSFYKSSRFNEKDSIITLIEKGCIVLFVFLKHWKPVGWDFFPGHFGEYEIDVRQSMCVKKHTLQMPSNGAYTQNGTVQGRIRRQGVNDKTFALTAAHVALKEEEVTRRRTELEVYEGDRLKRFGLPVGISTPGLHYVSVTKAALGGERHVDVALLELPKKLQLADIDWDWDDLGFKRPPTLLNGFQLWAPAQNDIVMKYGMTTGVTIGKVRGIDSSFENKETGFIEIQPWQPEKTQLSELGDSGAQVSTHTTFGLPSPQSPDSGSPASVPGTSGLPFSQPGDSGSLVFVVNKDIIKNPPQRGSNFRGSDLAVVGMVNMGLDGDSLFYATHIDATMAALGSEYRFDE